VNERALSVLSGSSAIASITLSHVAAGVSIAAGLVGIAAGLPVAVDRWRHKLPAWLTRHFPAK
jgi:hypothetical protein